MARTYKHFTVRFKRTVQQVREMDVTVPPELDGEMAEHAAQAIAMQRLSNKKWVDVGVSDPVILDVDAADAL
jgi:hypothetical protein